MKSTDNKFFTNEPERDLYSRFSTVLQSNTQFFDVLVGYFRTSGFFKLYDSMKSVEKIRILVGLSVDNYTVKIIDRAKQEIKVISIPTAESKELFADSIVDEFTKSEDTEETEKGVRIFIDWLKSGKLEMRMYTEAPIHAKVYIMRKDPVKVPDMYGSVITGSSNFSEAGLINNLEFNVELKDADDVNFALEKFEDLWAKGTDIRDTYIDTVENNTWIRDDITPYQLYLKTLYEFFKEEINSDKESFTSLLPPGFMDLKYQRDAVIQAKKILEAYNGVFISDVVGLGKTYICAMLANTINRNAYKLFVCPPVLVDYWKEVLQEFDVSRFDVISLGKLERQLEKGVDKYSYVFIDEAHRFRNSDTNAFTDLHQICRGKKVVLISATPINNYTTDIENQIYLFQDKQSGTINGIRNIEGFFRGLNSNLSKFHPGTAAYMKQMRDNSEIIRDKLLREIMVRRTRSEILEYYKDDLEKQGLTFPKAGSPEKIVYEFDETIDDAFKETISIIKDFKYSRYTPLLYLKDTKKYATMLISQKNMGGFMKGLLVKRLESSFYAFKMTLDRFINSYESFINMAMSGKIFISKKVNVYDLLDGGEIEKLMYYIEEEDVMEFETKEFKTQFFRDLENDLAQLKTLKNIWSLIDTDPKLDEFKRNLKERKEMKNKKIVVFTESKETADYLESELKTNYGDRVVCFSGQSSNTLKAEIEDSFNPKRIDKNNDKYDILITTDVLAEGINLHRANVLVNYDLPWNPTRIMQRVGRINRVGTEFNRIYVFNFFPTAQSKKQMPLEERILEKLQAFHDTLGEDQKYLTDEEEVSSKKLFDDMNQGLDDDGEGTNPELEYLNIIRKVRDEDPKLFDQVKHLPKKIKSGKASNLISDDTTITFIRKGALKTFYATDGINTERWSFMQAIKYIKSQITDCKIPIDSKYYEHSEINSKAFDDMIVEEKSATSDKAMIVGNDAKIIRNLKAMKNVNGFTDDQDEKIDILINRWTDGEMPSKVSKDVIKAIKSATDPLVLYKDIINIVPASYFNEKRTVKASVDADKQVILSCYLTSGGTN